MATSTSAATAPRARAFASCLPRIGRQGHRAHCPPPVALGGVDVVDRPLGTPDDDEPASVSSTIITHHADGADPWHDAPWSGLAWTVYRGVAYDLSDYLAARQKAGGHPGGEMLLRLAIGRDSTALFESYHMRPAVAAARLSRLPVLEGFPIEAVPRSPRPDDSPLYVAIRDRVRDELFDGLSGSSAGAHRRGTGPAAAAILGYACLAWALYLASPGPATGAFLGLAGAWIGLTIQHCGNHGAMSNSPAVNALFGLTSELTGGSALMWRYHHQVSHHVHCNDEALDEDVFSALPFLRFDPRLPRKWFHRYQHLYMWLTYPFLQVSQSHRSAPLPRPRASPPTGPRPPPPPDRDPDPDPTHAPLTPPLSPGRFPDRRHRGPVDGQGKGVDPVRRLPVGVRHGRPR